MAEIIYFIITIGILVFVHEFGHFAAAKLSGMRVDAFAIGFGYRLFGYNKKLGFTIGKLPDDYEGDGLTDYRLCALPLGGYVKIAGMIDESMDTDFASEEPKEYEFRGASVPKKVFVITAGVLMNLLLTVMIFWSINFFIGKQYTESTVVGEVRQETAADSAGFKSGDKILAINGDEVQYWEDIRNAIFVEHMGKDLEVKLARDGEVKTLQVSRSVIPPDESQGLFLVTEGLQPVISDVLEDSPADSAGVQPNDVLISVNNEKIRSIQQTIAIIGDHKNQPVDLTLLRGEDTTMVEARPDKEGKIGVMLGGYSYQGEIANVTYGFFESFYYSTLDVARLTELTFVMLGRVFSGHIEFGQAFGGPVKIAQFAARSADSGMISFLTFLAMLSLSLAILNILPFPVLDGGHLIIILVEGVIKREIPVKVKIAIQNAGFVLLMLLMAFIIYNDIINL